MPPKQIGRILAAVKDPAALDSVPIAKAAELARALSAQLVLFHAIDIPICADAYAGSDRPLGDDRDSIQQAYWEQLELQAKPLRAGGLEVSTAAEWDFPAYEAVLRYAVHSDVDLIVAEHRHRLHPALWASQPTDWELLRQSPMPLLLVKSAAGYRPGAVLAAVDPLHRHAKPADLDEQICGVAQLLSGSLGGPWEVLHASASGTDLLAAGQQTVRAAMEHLLQPLAPQPRAVRIVEGHPAEAIVRTATELASPVVVMGAISRSGLTRLALGNTAERVIDQLACDVLVVKPRDFGMRFPQAVRGMNLYTVPVSFPV